MRLIDADKLKEDVLDLPNCPNEFSGTYDKARILDLVDEQPAVDAEPVKHGHWTIEDIVTYERSYGGTLYEPVYKCSCCGRVTESYVRGDEPIMPEDADFPEFCGNCGAKMDEVKE